MLFVIPQSHSRGWGSFTRYQHPVHCTQGISVVASVYNDGLRTASGERFNRNKLTAAHRTLPFGSRITLYNPRNSRHVTVRINDRGPFFDRRHPKLHKLVMQAFDLTPAAHRALGLHGSQYICRL